MNAIAQWLVLTVLGLCFYTWARVFFRGPFR